MTGHMTDHRPPDGLTTIEYRAADAIAVIGADGRTRRGRVLEIDGDRVTVQVLDGAEGLGLEDTVIRSTGRTARLEVGPGLLGRTFDGAGRPADSQPPIVPHEARDPDGAPPDPVARGHPSEVVETGISAIDALITLVRGQKLPIFSGYGLPAGRLAARIAMGSRVHGATGDADFVVVFAALGVTRHEAEFYRAALAGSGRQHRTASFLNLADEPAIERLQTPRLALTAAEYLAWEEGRDVLVVMTDMTNYCEALRESDLASLFERTGRIRGRRGSITQLAILSMPDDDISHPIPDLAGYITEGQIVLSRDLDRRGIFPPIDVLPSLSRLASAGIGAGRTRDDHRDLADQLYACYARGRHVRDLASIVGTAGLGEDDRSYLDFADDFEHRFINQGDARRDITATLDLAWDLLARFPRHELKRIRPQFLDELHHPAAGAAADQPGTGGPGRRNPPQGGPRAGLTCRGLPAVRAPFRQPGPARSACPRGPSATPAAAR